MKRLVLSLAAITCLFASCDQGYGLDSIANDMPQDTDMNTELFGKMYFADRCSAFDLFADIQPDRNSGRLVLRTNLRVFAAVNRPLTLQEAINMQKMSDELMNRNIDTFYPSYAKARDEGRKPVYGSFVTAYINGSVTITADKHLFGQKPGEDLSGHFSVKTNSTMLPAGRDIPVMLYEFGEELPTEMAAFFAQGTWLQREYTFMLNDTPEEVYRTLCITVSIPCVCDNWAHYAIDLAKDPSASLKSEDKVYKATCTVNFAS